MSVHHPLHESVFVPCPFFLAQNAVILDLRLWQRLSGGVLVRRLFWLHRGIFDAQTVQPLSLSVSLCLGDILNYYTHLPCPVWVRPVPPVVDPESLADLLDDETDLTLSHLFHHMSP